MNAGTLRKRATDEEDQIFEGINRIVVVIPVAVSVPDRKVALTPSLHPMVTAFGALLRG
jgi:hypothetical protein